MTAEFTVDEIGEPKSDGRLKRNRPEHEMRGRLHRSPHISRAQDVAIPLGAEIDERPVGTIGLIVGEGQINRPDQRKDIDRQQEHDSRRDKEPSDGTIRKAANAARNFIRRRPCRPIGDALEIRPLC